MIVRYLKALLDATNNYYSTTMFSCFWQIGFQSAGKAVYTAVWVAAVSLFMELLGFPTQKWLTAGGLGTVLLTLAGREVKTPFLLTGWIFIYQKLDSHFLIHSDIHKFPFKCNDPCNTTICCE